MRKRKEIEQEIRGSDAKIVSEVLLDIRDLLDKIAKAKKQKKTK